MKKSMSEFMYKFFFFLKRKQICCNCHYEIELIDPRKNSVVDFFLNGMSWDKVFLKSKDDDSFTSPLRST